MKFFVFSIIICDSSLKCLKSALLKCNSNIMYFTFLKCTIQWCLVCSQSSATSLLFNSRIFFHHSNRKLHIYLSLLFNILYLQAFVTTNLLPLSMDLLIVNIYINEITHVGFSIWFLSLSLMFTRFIHSVICISTSFLFMAEWYSIIRISRVWHIH